MFQQCIHMVGLAMLVLMLCGPVHGSRHPLSTTASDNADARAYAGRLGSDAGGIHTWNHLVQYMNKYRARHGAPPLKWSRSLYASAASWAGNCKFQHSNTGGNYGENLAWNYGNWKQAVDAWYDEEKLYNYNSPGFSGSTGHFTAIVWKDSKEVACAYSCQIYVCQFKPAGNVIGYFDKNVAPKKW